MRLSIPMENEPQPVLGFDPVTGQPYSVPPAIDTPEPKKLLAPLWHTVLVIIMLLGNSLFTAAFTSHKTRDLSAITEHARIAQYAATILLEFFLLGVVWIGLRLKKTKIRELIGGRWNTPEDFLIDVAIAVGFWIVAVGVLAGLGYLLGLAKGAQAGEAKRLADMLAPRSALGLVIWVFLSTTAGFVEEIIFRGYLQRQIAAFSGNVYVGLVTSALIFGAGHGYEGTRRMILIAVYGAMFGVLAQWRKSLRPGMMAHAWHDAFQGFILRFVAEKGLPPMR
jgi:uncharacterized protein